MLESTSGPNFTVAHLGALNELEQYQFEHPVRKTTVVGKKFLHDILGATATEISFTKVPPSTSLPFMHSHKMNEEVFLVVQGEGEFQVDDEVFPIREGSVVRVATGGVRCLRNTSAAVPLIYVCIQATAGSLVQHTFQDGVPSARTPKWAATTPS